MPAWAPTIDPWMCVALSRYIIWGWPEGEAASYLRFISAVDQKATLYRPWTGIV